MWEREGITGEMQGFGLSLCVKGGVMDPDVGGCGRSGSLEEKCRLEIREAG